MRAFKPKRLQRIADGDPSQQKKAPRIVPIAVAISAWSIEACNQAEERSVRVLRVVSLFNRDLRGLLQVAPDYMRPVRYDARKLQGLLGPRQMTSYDAGIGQTLSWIASGR
jgi:hypothetical protein